MNRQSRQLDRIRRELAPAIRDRSATTPRALVGFTPDDALDIALSRTLDVARHEDAHVAAWLAQTYRRSTLQTERVPLAALDKWRINRDTGNIEHETGRFFTILGTKIRQRQHDDELHWNQPFVDQAEVGILGILAAEFDGVLHFCLQAKEEPGNINSVQLSPTVQATYSNYRQSHGGKAPPLVELFLNPRPQDILYSRLQTEDGGRFLYKSNRNMIVRCDPKSLPYSSDHFIWLTLRQIAGLLQRDNKINACARSILSSTLHAAPVARRALHPILKASGLTSTPAAWPADERPAKPADDNAHIRELLAWLDDQKAATHLHVARVPLKDLTDWHIDRDGYYAHKQRRFFRIIGLSVETTGREISKWTQPILENPREGIIGLLVQTIAGRRHLLLQAKAEPGNRPPVQLAPTVQFTPANYLDNTAIEKPFLFDEFLHPLLCKIHSDTRQSEEGARFYREEHLHRILELPEGARLDLPPNYRWFSLEAVRYFLHTGEHLNSCARSILSCLL